MTEHIINSTFLFMNAIKYDILDELTEPREINAAQVIVEQDVETQDSMTPEEFYNKFRELFCTHIFSINLMRTETMDVRRVKEDIQYLSEHYFGKCGLDVQVVEAPFGKVLPYGIDDIEEILVDPDELVTEPPYKVMFKVPIRIMRPADKKKVVKNLINFSATLYGIINKYLYDENQDGDIVSYHVDFKANKWKMCQDEAYIHTSAFYSRKFCPQSLYENNHNPNVMQSENDSILSMRLSLFCVLESVGIRMDTIEPIVHNWVDKYSPKTDFINEEDVADVIHDNADELSARTLEIDGHRYTIIS